ncbi:hypothetical protein VitviT2T_030422 [Vitis vinifera]|uniref:Retrotransposon Copia-like N-terminal domain-containing protein n=2 Tax=Vitis vinifera TaxID=29760 RepID=A0ABY9E2A4_VITVI|nr:hypothetical protein CK203_056103 [Vitis vinifera]WKA13089.1 hypothetical protein VitviT2T_030422 [Vitis vinifera]
MARGRQNNNWVVMSSTSSPVEDFSSSFFLHNGDHPRLIFVSHHFHGPNYNTWSWAMLLAFIAKNKMGFIDDSIPQPATTNDLLYGAWNRCNSMVNSWILNLVAKEIVASLLYISTTTEIWNGLGEQFHQTNAPQIFQVIKALMALNQGALITLGRE